MTESLILDLALARRLELAEAQAAVDSAESLRRRRADSGAAVEPIAGGYAVYCGAGSPLTQAVALGLAGPVSEEDFARLEEFYRARQEAVRVETCPLVDASLVERFGKHGYRVTEFTNVMALDMRHGDTQRWPDLPRGVSIHEVAPDELPNWALTVAQGFAETHAITKELLEVMELFGGGPHAECYLAYVDGKAAGGAALSIRDGIAGLFGASTLPEFRGRGVQTALLHTRLTRAAEASADLAMCLAQPGSTSQRNVVRQGFQVLYTRVKFEKDFSAGN